MAKPSKVEDSKQVPSTTSGQTLNDVEGSKLFRWWVYQRERFPILAHGPLIAAFSLSAVSYSSLARGASGLPTAVSAFVAFVSAFVFFLQLRIADEFKDFEEDSRYRPYRPVPRGLVRLRELGVLAIVGGVIQLALALGLRPALGLLLAGIWLYLGLMRWEFFIRDWLKARPFIYLWTHMLILPLIDLYATACDWLVAGSGLPSGLHWFLLLSFMNGTVLEIGRKIRAPQDEEPGVETYSVLWGRHKAVRAWLLALGLTAILAWLAADRIRFTTPVVGLVCPLLAAAFVIARHFLGKPTHRGARWIEAFSGIWTLLLYLCLGVIPRLLS